MTTEHPPLLGDKHGKYRILIIGNSGKSTLTTILSTKLNINSSNLDRLFWNPGWQETPTLEFKALVQQVMDQNPEGWIIDGNYTEKVGMMIQEQATDIIWLDPPLVLYFPRIFMRTIKRWWGIQELCSPGCGETFKDIFLSRKSILAFCIEHHFVVRKRCREMMRNIGIGIGLDKERNCMRRIGGWGGALKGWLQDVDDMVRKRP
ncbi:hypothetical protein AGABI1DRAFT_119860 [Agaricus bisporus var. burnettii JB137-S8]|uniref:Adenylate kinase n=1 Tax=Agaricus bisporus var. burnettii (strain JB137-S8 / ATCC MYA-4627 / FGSC 10392) TaxID=597362 RepID=K5X9Q7_AGABU|nr:uncharacterized protein AGABI1DRAFT_119860 [Agaricus bisporus var. burnettii JB137-S8]EKM79767.1 hypothetical protein AGABI1DRAFT_119860 [Agaricus bisporus var. burnettii JB137-S8]